MKNNKISFTSNSILLGGYYPYLWLGLTCFLLYGITLTFGFLPLDDNTLIVDRLHWLLEPMNIFHAFLSLYNDNLYRPILVISFIIDALIGSGNPIFYHLTNLILHTSVVLIFFKLLTIIFNNRTGSFLIALIFAVHPVNLQAIAWISGRNDLLLGVFFIISILSFYLYNIKKKWMFLLIHSVSFFLALFTKETAIFLPIIIILTAIFTNYNHNTWLFILFEISIIVIWLIFKLTFGGSNLISPDFTISGFYELLKYLIGSFGKIAIPYKLSLLPYYSRFPVIYFLITVSVLYIFFKFSSNYRKFIPNIFWIFGFLLIPGIWSVYFLSDNVHYEHRLYLPLMGFLITLGSVVQWKRKKNIIPAILFILYLSIVTIYRVNFYSSPQKFVDKAVQESPDCPRALAVRGNYYYTTDNLPLALLNINEAIYYNSESAKLYNMRGNIFQQLGKEQDAYGDYITAIKLDGTYVDPVYNLGNLFFEKKQLDQALYYYNTAIKLNNKFIPAYVNRSILHSIAGEDELAKNDLKNAIELGGTVSDDLINRIIKEE